MQTKPLLLTPTGFATPFVIGRTVWSFHDAWSVVKTGSKINKLDTDKSAAALFIHGERCQHSSFASLRKLEVKLLMGYTSAAGYMLNCLLHIT
jgi:hypothetical protein